MSESRGRRNRSLLSSYYGTEAPDADAAAAPPAADQDDSNIDGAAFDADKYVSSLLQQRSLEELVQRGNAMVSEIKSLDSDMQMLVYENYNKFISATDTIRQMKNRVDSMESQMLQLETNMGTISTASEAVNSSLSARRSELEKLNGVKKNLTKLQFLMDLPARLQACVAAEKYELAVKFHHKAKRMLAAVGRVAAFDGIREEAALIMGRLGHGLNARLAKPDLPPDVLGSTTLLLAQLEPAREEALLKEYLSRRRRELHDRLAAFAPEGRDAGDGEGTARARARAAARRAARREASSTTYVRQLSAAHVPALLDLNTAWRELFMAPPADGEAGAAPEAATAAGAAPAVSAAAKEAMLVEALQELTGGMIEVGRRRLQEEGVAADELLAGLRVLMGGVAEVHAAAPEADLLSRATRVAEILAMKAVDTQLQSMAADLTATVDALGDGSAAEGQLGAATDAVELAVSAAVRGAAPLLAPLAELLGTRADALAKHVVSQLHSALGEMCAAAAAAVSDGEQVLLRAGLCLRMASSGTSALASLLKRSLQPHGLGGAALGFDANSIARSFQRAADGLLDRFVELQAQALSLEVSAFLGAADTLGGGGAPPRAVTALVDAVLGGLRKMAALAAVVFPADGARAALPQGPFPASSSAVHLVQQRSRQAAGGSAIQKDMARLFARKISFGTSVAAPGARTSVAAMLTVVAKLTLKTLVEEVRLGTFGRSGFQQVQLDCAMLRWVLPASVDDDESVGALLDEAVISCQERCLDCASLDHAVIEALCEAKRNELRLAMA